MTTLSLDFRASPEHQVERLDVTSDDSGEVLRFRERLNRWAGSEPYLVLCLDMLEHIDRADVPAALANLHGLTQRYLLCSISTRPSSDFNLYHATVLPTAAWLDLLELGGFKQIKHPSLGALQSHNDYANAWNLTVVHHWRLLDPYREAQNAEPNYVLLEKVAPQPDQRRRILEVARCRIESPAIQVSRDIVFTFLVGHTQNFSLYEPFWDVLPSDQVNVLVREGPDGVIDATRMACLDAWFRARGMRYRLVRSVDDATWDDSGRQVFISASESTAADCHLQNLAFVAEARYHGYLTALLQHGIWIEDMPATVAFLSDVILAWSDEHLDCFRGPSTLSPPDRQWTRGVVDSGRFRVVGCPKFDAYTEPIGPSLRSLFGEWAGGFKRMVLMTTNLLWHRHSRSGSPLHHHLSRAAEQMPDALFVLKLHPSENPQPDVLSTLPPNVVVLSEIACWCAGIRSSDLVRAADIVVTTLSTMALEAALARKPVLVLDTGTGVAYRHMRAEQPSALPGILQDTSRRWEPSHRFRDHYYDVSTLGNARQRALAVLSATMRDGTWPRQELSAADVIARQLGRLATSYAAQLVRKRQG